MNSKEWFSKHRQTVLQSVAWMKDKPTGTIWEKRSALHRIVVYREDGVIRMYFVDPRAIDGGDLRSGAMSALKLDDPFDLSPTPYNQSMMLSLLWRDQPERIYMAGFAGGRIPLMFYHYFPNAIIDSTDIDAEVVALAQKFFGIEYDERQRLFIKDGREFLTTPDAASDYDFIFVDVFRGVGFSPPHLATTEFYNLCREHLKPGGVVAINLVESDPLFGRRIATLASCFQSTYVQVDRTIVLFGTDASFLSQGDIASRAKALQTEHEFSFPFIQRATTVKPLQKVDELWKLREQSEPLTDKSEAAELFPLSAGDPLFYRVGRNDSCPCGSGKKFKKCHGRMSSVRD
jgi:spermidine synthase